MEHQAIEERSWPELDWNQWKDTADTQMAIGDAATRLDVSGRH